MENQKNPPFVRWQDLKQQMDKTHREANSRTYCENMLEQPSDQVEEILYELLSNYTNGRTSLQLCKATNSVNVHNAIKRIRDANVDVLMETQHGVNRFGRNVTFGLFRIQDFKRGVELYNKWKSGEPKTKKSDD